MSLRPPLLGALLGALACGNAEAIEVDFGKCRSIAEPAARLACYDTIPYRVAPTAGAASVASAPARPASLAGSAVAAVPMAAERFGLAERAAPAELQSIQSSVPADFTGWGPNEQIRLENGQVWQVMDGSSGSVAPAQRKVVVRRGAFGSFFLEFEGLNSSPRVRRLR